MIYNYSIIFIYLRNGQNFAGGHAELTMARARSTVVDKSATLVQFTQGLL